MATDKQVSYLLSILSRNGYDTRFMNSTYKELGARMNERQGSVIDWLKSLDNGRVDELIRKLKK